MKEGLDWIARGIANVAADIRHKVVEEPWFGREVTPDTPQIEAPDSWWRGKEASAPNPEPQEAVDPDQAIRHSHQR